MKTKNKVLIDNSFEKNKLSKFKSISHNKIIIKNMIIKTKNDNIFLIIDFL